MTEEMKSVMNTVCKILDYGAHRGHDAENHRFGDITRHSFTWYV